MGSRSVEYTMSTDDSDGEGGSSKQNCPICLVTFRNQDIGTPESCDHNFCLDCIIQWSKNVNTCPFDRQPFHIVFARHRVGGKIYRKVQVEDCSLPAEPQDDPTHCEVCHRETDEDRMLLCDICDNGYHMDCLTPALTSIPEGDWFCPECNIEQPEDLPSTSTAVRRTRPRAVRTIPRTSSNRRVFRRIINIAVSSTSGTNTSCSENDSISGSEDDSVSGSDDSESSDSSGNESWAVTSSETGSETSRQCVSEEESGWDEEIMSSRISTPASLSRPTARKRKASSTRKGATKRQKISKSSKPSKSCTRKFTSRTIKSKSSTSKRGSTTSRSNTHTKALKGATANTSSAKRTPAKSKTGKRKAKKSTTRKRKTKSTTPKRKSVRSKTRKPKARKSTTPKQKATKSTIKKSGRRKAATKRSKKPTKAKRKKNMLWMTNGVFTSSRNDIYGSPPASFQSVSVKQRLAAQLGIIAPKAAVPGSLPRVASKAPETPNLAQSFSIFGDSNSSMQSERSRAAVARVVSNSGLPLRRPSATPASSSGLYRPSTSSSGSVAPPRPSSSAPDLLGSILDSQTVLTSSSRNVFIQPDGTLKIKSLLPSNSKSISSSTPPYLKLSQAKREPSESANTSRPTSQTNTAIKPKPHSLPNSLQTTQRSLTSYNNPPPSQINDHTPSRINNHTPSQTNSAVKPEPGSSHPMGLQPSHIRRESSSSRPPSLQSTQRSLTSYNNPPRSQINNHTPSWINNHTPSQTNSAVKPEPGSSHPSGLQPSHIKRESGSSRPPSLHATQRPLNSYNLKPSHTNSAVKPEPGSSHPSGLQPSHIKRESGSSRSIDIKSEPCNGPNRKPKPKLERCVKNEPFVPPDDRDGPDSSSRHGSGDSRFRLSHPQPPSRSGNRTNSTNSYQHNGKEYRSQTSLNNSIASNPPDSRIYEINLDPRDSHVPEPIISAVDLPACSLNSSMSHCLDGHPTSLELTVKIVLDTGQLLGQPVCQCDSLEKPSDSSIQINITEFNDWIPTDLGLHVETNIHKMLSKHDLIFPEPQTLIAYPASQKNTVIKMEGRKAYHSQDKESIRRSWMRSHRELIELVSSPEPDEIREITPPPRTPDSVVEIATDEDDEKANLIRVTSKKLKLEISSSDRDSRSPSPWSKRRRREWSYTSRTSVHDRLGPRPGGWRPRRDVHRREVVFTRTESSRYRRSRSKTPESRRRYHSPVSRHRDRSPVSRHRDRSPVSGHRMRTPIEELAVKAFDEWDARNYRSKSRSPVISELVSLGTEQGSRSTGDRDRRREVRRAESSRSGSTRSRDRENGNQTNGEQALEVNTGTYAAAENSSDKTDDVSGIVQKPAEEPSEKERDINYESRAAKQTNDRSKTRRPRSKDRSRTHRSQSKDKSRSRRSRSRVTSRRKHSKSRDRTRSRERVRRRSRSRDRWLNGYRTPQRLSKDRSHRSSPRRRSPRRSSPRRRSPRRNSRSRRSPRRNLRNQRSRSRRRNGARADSRSDSQSPIGTWRDVNKLNMKDLAGGSTLAAEVQRTQQIRLESFNDPVETTAALDKPLESTPALNKSMESTHALNKSVESTPALSEPLESAPALNKSMESTLALSKSVESTHALSEPLESIAALNNTETVESPQKHSSEDQVSHEVGEAAELSVIFRDNWKPATEPVEPILSVIAADAVEVIGVASEDSPDSSLMVLDSSNPGDSLEEGEIGDTPPQSVTSPEQGYQGLPAHIAARYPPYKASQPFNLSQPLNFSAFQPTGGPPYHHNTGPPPQLDPHGITQQEPGLPRLDVRLRHALPEHHGIPLESRHIVRPHETHLNFQPHPQNPNIRPNLGHSHPRTHVQHNIRPNLGHSHPRTHVQHNSRPNSRPEGRLDPWHNARNDVPHSTRHDFIHDRQPEPHHGPPQLAHHDLQPEPHWGAQHRPLRDPQCGAHNGSRGSYRVIPHHDTHLEPRHEGFHDVGGDIYRAETHHLNYAPHHIQSRHDVGLLPSTSWPLSHDDAAETQQDTESVISAGSASSTNTLVGQERVAEEVKTVLKPFFWENQIDKEEYKMIMRNCVSKIYQRSKGQVNPAKVKYFVEQYVETIISRRPNTQPLDQT